jgi:hypothetical protein
MKNRIRKFNESDENFYSISDENGNMSSDKVYTKDDVINIMYDFEIKRLGKFDTNTDEERNFTNPNGHNYVNLDYIKSKIVDFMKDK